MKIIVIKFGGTSLNFASHRQAAIKIVKERIQSGYQPVIVVSAMGRLGEPYATDTLQLLLPDSTGNDIKDFISNCGEMISAAVFAAELNFQNITSKPLTGWQAGIVTDNVFGASQIKEIRIKRIYTLIEQHIVPVISGFQGISETGELTTLGRGGSEITAILIAKVLKAERLEIFKDVDGVFTANPEKVPAAQLIREINYEELSEITGSGARVVNNLAAQIAEADQIAIGVGNTLTGEIGTTVKTIIKKELISSISSKQNLTLIRITTAAENRFSDIFPLFSEAGISLDFITVDNCHISFVVEISDITKVEEILSKIIEKSEISSSYSKITLIGSGMTGRPGVMARISRILNDNDIPVIMATDSYSTISVLIKSELEISALNKLHQTLVIEEK